jgi:hypothetical protein
VDIQGDAPHNLHTSVQSAKALYETGQTAEVADELAMKRMDKVAKHLYLVVSGICDGSNQLRHLSIRRIHVTQLRSLYSTSGRWDWRLL